MSEGLTLYHIKRSYGPVLATVLARSYDDAVAVYALTGADDADKVLPVTVPPDNEGPMVPACTPWR